MGTKPFERVVPRKGNTHLRMLLHSVGVADAGEYRTHDLRRGHTKDMAEAGSSLKHGRSWEPTCWNPAMRNPIMIRNTRRPVPPAGATYCGQ